MAKKKNQSVALPQDEKPQDASNDHSMLIEWVNEADDATQTSRDWSEKCRNYYDSRQWSEAEARALAKRKQAATVINRIKPKMDGLMGMERANKTTAKAYPRTPQHEKAATAATEAVRFVLQDNFYDQLRSSAWDNLLLEGTGGLEVVVKAKGDDFRITINHVPWDRIIYDPHSRRKDFSDARYLGQVVWMDYDQALSLYPDAGDVLNSMVSGSRTYDDKPRWIDTRRKRVKIVELYYRKAGEAWYACFTYGGFCETPKVSPYKNEEGETEWPYEFASLFVSLDCDRYGAALQYLDVQDEINKRRSKALHLMSVRQVAYMKGAVDDPNELRKQLALPDGAIELTQPIKDTFEILKTNDMMQAQFHLLEEAKMEIDAVGYSAAASGKEERLMSGVALRNREAASQTELAPMFDVLKHLDIRVYRKVWNRIKQYWKTEKWIRVTDDQQNLRWVGLNKPLTKGEQMLQAAQEQGMPPEQLQAMQQQIQMDPMMREVVSTENDVAELDVDIVMDDAPDSVTMQMEEFQTLGEMVKSGIPIPPDAVIEASNLNNKDKILKRMRGQLEIPPQVQEQMKKMQEEHAAMQEENMTLKAGVATDQAKIAARVKEKEAELQLEAQVQAETLKRERERVGAEIELKRAVAQAEIEIDAAKCAAQCANDEKRLAMDQTKMEAERKMGDEKMAFDQKARMHDMMPDQDFAKFFSNQVAASDVMPGITGIVTQAFSTMEAAIREQSAYLAQILQTQQATLAAFERPRSVSIGQVQKGADERITGATIRTTLQ